VVQQLTTFVMVLGAGRASPDERLEALKWIVHLVGDIHQPLHTADHDDKGGNMVGLSFFGKHTNLHAVWDGGIIEHALELHLGPDYSFDHEAVAADARKLDAEITPADRAAWAEPAKPNLLVPSVINWANESHALARSVAYADLPAELGDDWSGAYQTETWPVVEGQLERAGVRLADVLNKALP
jgi:hypothetical protein